MPKKFLEKSDSDFQEDNEIESEAGQKIDTVKDFMDILKLHYDEAENKEMKRKIAHQIIKLEIALHTSHLLSKEVYVRETEDGILGYYDPEAKKIAISRETLDDCNTDQQLFNTILVHESIHSEGIADEGLTQILAAKKISAAPNIYAKEQEMAQKTFYHEGINKALELYDIDEPEELIGYYLHVELENAWENTLASRFKREMKHVKNFKEVIEKMSEDESEKYEDEFEEGVPRLYEKLEKRNFDFKKEIELILKELIKDKLSLNIQ